MKVKLTKGIKYTGDIHQALVDRGWGISEAAEFLKEIPNAGSIMEELEACKAENRMFREEIAVLSSLHSHAVDRVNKVVFAKLQVESRLDLLGSMVDIILTEFRQKTTEGTDGK